MKLTDNSVYLLATYDDICISRYNDQEFYDLWCSNPKNLYTTGWSILPGNPDIVVLAKLGCIHSVDHWVALAARTHPEHFL